MPSPVPDGAFFDLFLASVLTASTLARLRRLLPESCFAGRRFRMNVIVDTDREALVENGWIGRGLEIGDRARPRQRPG